VIVIGAGVSGILAGIRLQQYIPGVDLTIYEKNSSLGGTWFENRYPGLACDIPSHVYQYTFEHNTQWSSFFSGGPEILKYVQGVAEKYKVEKYITYNSRVCGAVWNDETAKWKVKVETDGEIKEDECNVLFSASGVLNNWKWPDIPGLKDYKGKLLHSAHWDTEWYEFLRRA
jgi:cation diffusion facilitator CzcD-associated flavoprotein CzcO